MNKSKRRRAGVFLLFTLSCIAVLLLLVSRKQSHFAEYGFIISVALNFAGLFVIYWLLYHLGQYKAKYQRMQRKIADIETIANGEVLFGGKIYQKVGTGNDELSRQHYDDSSCSDYSTGSSDSGKNPHNESSQEVITEIEVLDPNGGGESPVLPAAALNSIAKVVKSESGVLEIPCTGNLMDKDFLATLVEEYNSARTDWTLQSQFLDRYHHAWFYVENAMARRQSPNAAPLFMTYDNGFYMAVGTKEQQGRNYVFPRFGVSYSESMHGPGAMGEVFKPCNYSHDESYDTIEVIEPAVFSRKDARVWSFEKSGSIKLML